MKKLRNLFLSLLLAVSATAVADEYAYLTISQEGSETSIAVSSIDHITFDSSNMVLHLTNGTEQTMPLSNLSKMFFTENGSSGIATVSGNQSNITLKDGVLYVKNVPGSTVTVYNAGGQTVRKITARETETQLNLSGLTKGVYIVKVGTETKKIMNK